MNKLNTLGIKMPTITNPFKARNDGAASDTNSSANETGSPTQTRSLPHYPAQDSKKSFNRFHRIFNKGPSGSSRQSLEMARDRHLTRSENIASIEKKSHDKIDFCLQTDWSRFASNRPDLAADVDKLMSNVTVANDHFKQKVSDEIQSLSGRIDQEMESARLLFKAAAKQQTRKTALERMGMGFARTKYQERMAQRKEIEKEKLDAFEAQKMDEFRQQLSQLELMHPSNLQDEGTVYFRQFADGAPQPLKDMMEHITDHALKVMAGEIGPGSDAQSISDDEKSLLSRAASSRPSSIASTTTFVSTFSSLGNQSLKNAPHSRPVSTVSSSTLASTTSSISKDSFVTATTSGLDSERASTIFEQEPEHNIPARSAEKTVPPTEGEITAAVDFFGGDELDAGLKSFLEGGELPDAKLNDQGEAEWIPKK